MRTGGDHSYALGGTHALDKSPQGLLEEYAYQPGHSHVCLRINEPAATQVITEVELRAGDIVHSLRAALDNLAWAVDAESDSAGCKLSGAAMFIGYAKHQTRGIDSVAIELHVIGIGM